MKFSGRKLTPLHGKMIWGLSAAVALGAGIAVLPFDGTTFAASPTSSSTHTGSTFVNGTPNIPSIPAQGPSTRHPGPVTVQVTGTPLPAPTVPANAIHLKLGQSIPENAPIGQSYVLPKWTPPAGSNILIVHANPGQQIHVSNYQGNVLIEPTYPMIATIVPVKSGAVTETTNNAAIASSIPGRANGSTGQITTTFSNGEKGFGNIVDLNGTWVTVDHAMNRWIYNSSTSSYDYYAPTNIQIIFPNGTEAVNTSDFYDISSTTYGLASPINLAAPTGSGYNATVVTHQTVGQSATVVSAWNPSTASFGITTQSTQLVNVNDAPIGYDPYPADPTDADSYNEFAPLGIVWHGWSGAGIWNSKGHLLGIVEGANQSLDAMWAINGTNITDFCDFYGIPFTGSTGT